MQLDWLSELLPHFPVLDLSGGWWVVLDYLTSIGPLSSLILRRSHGESTGATQEDTGYEQCRTRNSNSTAIYGPGTAEKVAH